MKTTVELFSVNYQNMATIHIRFPPSDSGVISVNNSVKPYYNYDYDQMFSIYLDHGKGWRDILIKLHRERIQLRQRIASSKKGSKKTVKTQTKEVEI